MTPLIILDNGHGCDTKGKRSPDLNLGIEEWEFNRDIVRRIGARLHPRGIEYMTLVPEFHSVSLTERVRRVNQAVEHRRGLLISVHANASGDGNNWTKAQGSAVFVYKGAPTVTRDIAALFDLFIAGYGDFSSRGVKDSGFYILKKTSCSAILTENGFMTNSSEALKLRNPEWRERIAYGHFLAITKVLESSYLK